MCIHNTEAHYLIEWVGPSSSYHVRSLVYYQYKGENMLCASIRVFNTKESRRLGVLSQQTRCASALRIKPKYWEELFAGGVSFVRGNVKNRRSNGVVTLIRRGSFFFPSLLRLRLSRCRRLRCCYLNWRPTCCSAPGGRAYSRRVTTPGLSVGPV